MKTTEKDPVLTSGLQIYMPLHTHTHSLTQTNAHTHIHIYTYTNTHIYSLMHARTHAHTYTHICAHMYTHNQILGFDIVSRKPIKIHLPTNAYLYKANFLNHN